MTYRLDIPFLHPPSAHPHVANFFRYVLNQDGDFSHNINSELKKYNGIYVVNDYDMNAHIDFVNREDYIIFLLRWS
jgi:hypothetical protein